MFLVMRLGISKRRTAVLLASPMTSPIRSEKALSSGR